MATVTRERELLRELVALVRGECPSLLNEDSGGDVRLSMAIDDALASPPAEDDREWLRRQSAKEDGGVVSAGGLVTDLAQAPPASDPPGLVANWRPIETAPKRTDVLAGWADRPHWLPQVLQQDDAGMWFNGEESDYRPPTHWMPLPASPQAKED